ncbi:MAG: DUF2182 domain-containing protein [Bacteroidota bacterium]
MQNSRLVDEKISYWMIGISAFMWIVLLFNPAMHHDMTGHDHSHMASVATTIQHTLPGMVWNWVLMVLAMMLPKLIAPIQHIYSSSFKKRQLRSAFIFISGYTAVWTATGALMLTSLMLMNHLIPGSILPILITGIVAIIWQFSPLKQRFLNRAHGHRALSVFGGAADRDALFFGFEHGFWCVGSGWIIMFFPMLLPHGLWHYLVMFFVAFIMISEHMERPQIPEWRMRTGMKLLRIITAQTKMRLGEVFR